MVSQFKYLVVLFLSCFSLGSCYYYTPHITPPVLVDKKGEMDADIGISIGMSPGAFASVAYSPLNRTFAQVYTSAFTNKDFHSQVLIGGSIISKPRIQLRLASGYSFGTLDMVDEPPFKKKYITYTKGQYQMLYGKLLINGRLKNERNNFGLSLMFGKYYPQFDIRTENLDEYENNPIAYSDLGGSCLVFEPTFYYQFNDSKRLGFTFFYTIGVLDESFLKSNSEIGVRLPIYNEVGNFGVALRIRLTHPDR